MFRSIVVGTDGSETAGEAVRQAIELARRSARDRAVSAYEPVSEQRLREERAQAPGGPAVVVNPREDVDATLREAAERRRGGRREGRHFARQGDPADAILDVAEERGADLIVVGNKGMTGAKRFLLGSRAEQGLAPRALLGADHPDDLEPRPALQRSSGAVGGAAASSRPAP